MKQRRDPMSNLSPVFVRSDMAKMNLDSER